MDNNELLQEFDICELEQRVEFGLCGGGGGGGGGGTLPCGELSGRCIEE
jgi:hypothetical protein